MSKEREEVAAEKKRLKEERAQLEKNKHDHQVLARNLVSARGEHDWRVRDFENAKKWHVQKMDHLQTERDSFRDQLEAKADSSVHGPLGQLYKELGAKDEKLKLAEAKLEELKASRKRCQCKASEGRRDTT